MDLKNQHLLDLRRRRCLLIRDPRRALTTGAGLVGGRSHVRRALRRRRLLGLLTKTLTNWVFTRGGSVAGIILNTDKSSQFTSHDLTRASYDHGLCRSMDATGSCWRTLAPHRCGLRSNTSNTKRHAFTSYANFTVRLDSDFRYLSHDRRHCSLRMVSPIDFEIASRINQLSSQHRPILHEPESGGPLACKYSVTLRRSQRRPSAWDHPWQGGSVA